jgi:hypothetical protein
LLFICLNFWDLGGSIKDGLMDEKGALDQGEGFTFLMLEIMIFLNGLILEG